jgi:hypothetical protein
MRGKAHISFLGVVQPRFRDATFPIIVPAPWFPLFANPAVSCWRKVVFLACLLVLFTFVRVLSVHRRHVLVSLSTLTASELDRQLLYFLRTFDHQQLHRRNCCRWTPRPVLHWTPSVSLYIQCTDCKLNIYWLRPVMCLKFRSNMRVSWRRLALCWSIKPQVE